MKKLPHLFLFLLFFGMIASVLTWYMTSSTARSAPLWQAPPRDPAYLLQEQQALNRMNDFAQGTMDGEVALTEVQAAAQLGFVTIADDNERMKIDVPAQWQDIETGVWQEDGQTLGLFVTASTDLARFNGDLSAPGLFFGASSVLLSQYTEDTLLDREDKRLQRIDKQCRKKLKVIYSDPFYKGGYHPYDLCRQQGKHLYLSLVTIPPHRRYVLLLRLNFPEGANPAVIKRIFDTFQLLGDPTLDDEHDH